MIAASIPLSHVHRSTGVDMLKILGEATESGQWAITVDNIGVSGVKTPLTRGNCYLLMSPLLVEEAKSRQCMTRKL